MSHHAATEEKPVLAFGSGIAFALLLVALLIAAINFVKVNTAHDAHHGPAAVEAHGGNHPSQHEAPKVDNSTNVDHSQVTNTAPVPNADSNQSVEPKANEHGEVAH